MTHGFPLIPKALNSNRIILYFKNSMVMYTLHANSRIFDLSFHMTLAICIPKAWHSVLSKLWPEVDSKQILVSKNDIRQFTNWLMASCNASLFLVLEENYHRNFGIYGEPDMSSKYITLILSNIYIYWPAPIYKYKRLKHINIQVIQIHKLHRRFKCVP